MVLNEKITKFLVIRGAEEDTVPLTKCSTKIDYVHSYLYLGTWITDGAKMTTGLGLHETLNEMQLNKFAIFVLQTLICHLLVSVRCSKQQ